MLNTRTSTYQSPINFFVNPLQNQKSPSEKCVNAYTFGFNGKENDYETYGNGNAYDFGARIQDARLGKFLSIDQYADKLPNQSNYSHAGNCPIILIDKNGDFKMPESEQKKYPQLTNLLQNIQQTIHNDPKAYAAFRDNLGLTDEQANAILEWGKGPMISVQPLNGPYGTTTISVFKTFGYITLDKNLINTLEGKKSNEYTNTYAGLILLVYATALHEGQHSAQNKKLGIGQLFEVEDPKYDNGYFFEKKAFGESVNDWNADEMAKNNYPNITQDLGLDGKSSPTSSSGNYGGSGMGMMEEDPLLEEY